VAIRFRTFSLRTLLVVVTALCAFLAYEMNWIRQRRQFIAEQNRQLDLHGIRESFDRVPRNQRAPSLLSWFGERPYEMIALFVPVNDTPKSRVNGFPDDASREEDAIAQDFRIPAGQVITPQ